MNAIQYFQWGGGKRKDFITIVFEIDANTKNLMFSYYSKSNGYIRKTNGYYDYVSIKGSNKYVGFRLSPEKLIVGEKNTFEFQSSGLYTIDVQGLAGVIKVDYIDLSNANEIVKYTSLNITCNYVYVNQQQMNKINAGQLPDWRLPVGAQYLVK